MMLPQSMLTILVALMPVVGTHVHPFGTKASGFRCQVDAAHPSGANGKAPWMPNAGASETLEKEGFRV